MPGGATNAFLDATHDPLAAELRAVHVTAFFRAKQMTDASLHAAFAVRANVLVGARW